MVAVSLSSTIRRGGGWRAVLTGKRTGTDFVFFYVAAFSRSLSLSLVVATSRWEYRRGKKGVVYIYIVSVFSANFCISKRCRYFNIKRKRNKWPRKIHLNLDLSEACTRLRFAFRSIGKEKNTFKKQDYRQESVYGPLIPS